MMLILELIWRSFVATVLLAAILCGVYPLLVTGIGKALMGDHANGSLVTKKVGSENRVVGSKWIGQLFTKPEYFHGRPSVAGSAGYDATSSSGSNLGPTNQKFADTLKANIETVLKENPTLKRGEIPTDLVTASGSGLDPHISPESAFAQVDRVASARGQTKEKVKSLVETHIEGPQLGIFGEPVVNVLLLNLDLDQLF